MIERPADWPGIGPIDLAVHDLPHRSAMTEWWYINTHLKTADGRELAVFASFFRVVSGRDEATGAPTYGHALTWAMSDLHKGAYYSDSIVDKSVPALGLERLDAGEGPKHTRDPRIRRAMREILERGNVPYPDHMFESDPFVHQRKLELDFDGNRFSKDAQGRYVLELFHAYHKCGVTLVLDPKKAAVRHGDDGVVKGHDGADMFYYFIPRCDVSGSVLLDGQRVPLAEGSGWYDHEFGGLREEHVAVNDDVAWNWIGAQLDDGREISAYSMTDLSTGEPMGSRCLIIGEDGSKRDYTSLSLTSDGSWQSSRTFNEYPTKWRLQVPEAGLDLAINAAFDDQEFVTLVSKPAFWEGRCSVSGTVDGADVSGKAWFERSGYVVNNNLEEFFKSVGKRVRASVARLLPYEPSFEQVRDLIASEEREHYMEGVDLEEFVKTGVVPVREITDRGGKGWRSYAALACCDVVGGDSRDFVHWLAMPELMHVGSLIVDDVQDGSSVRRGGAACHTVHGDALAINAGTSCYFMGQHLLQGTVVSDREKLRLYDLYFEALRAGHAGQAADIKGLGGWMPDAVESGKSDDLEKRVLAIHRLKTAAPASALSRMGAIVGGGSEVQIEGLGRYFESLGLAFQIVDDVLNLRGFERGLKSRGEDITHGKVTLPVAKAMSRLETEEERQWIWDTLQTMPEDPAVVGAVIEKLEACGAVQACADEACALVEEAWATVQPLLEDSIVGMMLRSFGWFVLERHY